MSKLIQFTHQGTTYAFSPSALNGFEVQYSPPTNARIKLILDIELLGPIELEFSNWTAFVDIMRLCVVALETRRTTLYSGTLEEPQDDLKD